MNRERRAPKSVACAPRRNLSDDRRAAIALRVMRRRSEVAQRERAKVAGDTGGRGRPKENSLSDTSSDKLSTPPTPRPAAKIAEGLTEAIAVAKGEAEPAAVHVPKAPPPFNFSCDCGGTFDIEVWHCPKCDHHWQMHRDACFNCYADRPGIVAAPPPPAPKPKQDTRAAVAREAHVPERKLRAVAEIEKKDPDAIGRIARGESTIVQERSKINAQERAEVAQRPVVIPDGKYRVIVIDPPWQMEKIERDVRPNQVGFEYPTRSGKAGGQTQGSGAFIPGRWSVATTSAALSVAISAIPPNHNT